MFVKIMLARIGTAHSRLASIANTLPVSSGAMHLVIWALMGAEKRSLPTSTLMEAMKRSSLVPARARKI